MRPIEETTPPRGDDQVESAQSAALFVGIRDFPDDETLTKVRYAVDDAVDLAFLLAIGRHPVLVNPQRVVLALSGDPQKPESQRRLQALIAAGAEVKPAGLTSVLKLLEKQSGAVGRNGLLIVAFATHGVSDDGTQYLLMADSLLRHRDTAIAETKLRDIVSRANVPRSLLLLDACRRRLTEDRGGEPDPRSAAGLMKALAGIDGQVVFSAAAAGEYAYDDDVRHNGVFTAAVMDGLQCAAPTDPRGFITVDTLSSYVEERVVTWIRRHRDRTAKRATQLHSEGRAKAMPLALCKVQ